MIAVLMNIAINKLMVESVISCVIVEYLINLPSLIIIVLRNILTKIITNELITVNMK